MDVVLHFCYNVGDVVAQDVLFISIIRALELKSHFDAELLHLIFLKAFQKDRKL